MGHEGRQRESHVRGFLSSPLRGPSCPLVDQSTFRREADDMTLARLAAAGHGPFEPFKHGVNFLTQPYFFLPLSMLIFVLMLVLYRLWTKPLVAGTLFLLFLVFYFGSVGDPNFREIVAKPDNVPITIMVISVMVCIWLGFRRA